MPAIECPHCGNQDLTMLRVIGRDVVKNTRSLICEVCSKTFIHQHGEKKS